MGQLHHGKSNLAIELAKKVNGEIISADSMQIYKEMDIGTAKIRKNEMQGISHYLLDFKYPNERYSVSDYKKDAEKKIDEIIKNGKIPIIVGGTGLYIDSLVQGIEFEDEEFDQEYRNYLDKIVAKEGLETLYNKAYEIDKGATEKVSKNDKKRILRILEIYHKTGKTKTKRDEESKKNGIRYDYIIFAIDLPREVLYERINCRVEEMLKHGLIEEVKKLLKKYNDFPTAMQGIGYKEAVEYINGEESYENMVENIKKGTRHYAKRQFTWFKKYKNIIWLDGLAEKEKNIEIIEQTLK